MKQMEYLHDLLMSVLPNSSLEEEQQASEIAWMMVMGRCKASFTLAELKELQTSFRNYFSYNENDF